LFIFFKYLKLYFLIFNNYQNKKQETEEQQNPSESVASVLSGIDNEISNNQENIQENKEAKLSQNKHITSEDLSVKIPSESSNQQNASISESAENANNNSDQKENTIFEAKESENKDMPGINHNKQAQEAAIIEIDNLNIEAIEENLQQEQKNSEIPAESNRLKTENTNPEILENQQNTQDNITKDNSHNNTAKCNIFLNIHL